MGTRLVTEAHWDTGMTKIRTVTTLRRAQAFETARIDCSTASNRFAVLSQSLAVAWSNA
jgi:hypothetical protein